MLLSFESQQNRTGSEANIKRLTEIIFIQVLRVWNELNEGNHGFLSILVDKRLSLSINAFHEQPNANWTVGKMARTAGMSRTSFAESFKSIMKIPPMQYVTDWRMQNAQRLLASTDAPINVIANDIGYESVAAFSKAVRGGGYPFSGPQCPAHWDT